MGFRMWSSLAIFAPPEQPVRGAAGHQWLTPIRPQVAGGPRPYRQEYSHPRPESSHFSVFTATVAGCSPLERANFISRWSTLGEGRIARGSGRYRCPLRRALLRRVPLLLDGLKVATAPL